MSAARDASPSEIPTDADFLARARLLVPTLAAREAEATAARNVPAETIEDLRQAGLLRLLRPRRFGGHQASVGVFLQAVEILAGGCASSGWVYGVLAELEWIIACLPERAQIDIWGGDPESLAVATTIPGNTATRTRGGWRFSGRQPFASGCRHARWVIVGARCQDEAGREEEPRYLAIPMAETEILDDWHALGMRGTGSFSLMLRDVFIPEHRTVTIADILAGTPPGRLVHPDHALLRAPRYYLVPFVLPAVGFALARRALALVPSILRGRGSLPSDARLLRLGEAAALIESGHLIFTTRRAAAVAGLEAGAPIPEAEVLRNRRDVVLAFQMISQGVERLVALTGARSVYDDDPLQAIRRDLATIATHIVVNEEGGMVPYGRFLMRTA
jgi:3-hydroxy-9,10-secoandrosta-1,3,5(10)-triene-9,17-dione monooxygenase